MGERPKILLTGASGQVGGALLPLLRELGEVVAPARAELDLAHAASVRAFVREVEPRWIVNPGAYTAVDKAESETALAYAVNAVAPGILGEEAARLGAGVVHFSTDYVFSGAGQKPWREDDQPAPAGVYGATKLEGERALAASGAEHVILRTSWVYGATGKNFLLTILRAARERPELRIVDDQHGAPTWSYELARLGCNVVVHGLNHGLEDVSGVYHAAAGGETTWYGFAQAAVERERARTGGAWARLVPITTAEYPTPAKRPANSRMDCGRLKETFGWELMDWQDGLEAVLRERSGMPNPHD